MAGQNEWLDQQLKKPEVAKAYAAEKELLDLEEENAEFEEHIAELDEVVKRVTEIHRDALRYRALRAAAGIDGGVIIYQDLTHYGDRRPMIQPSDIDSMADELRAADSEVES